MDNVSYWKENMLKKEIRKSAYEQAEKLLKNFNKPLITASYLHSIKDRLHTYKTSEIEKFVKDLENEKARKKVKEYWSEKNSNNTTLSDEVSSIITKKALAQLRNIGRNQRVNIMSVQEKYHYLYISYFFCYLADLRSLIKKLSEEKTHVNNL